jgi:hypothetical protein
MRKLPDRRSNQCAIEEELIRSAKSKRAAIYSQAHQRPSTEPLLLPLFLATRYLRHWPQVK